MLPNFIFQVPKLRAYNQVARRIINEVFWNKGGGVFCFVFFTLLEETYLIASGNLGEWMKSGLSLKVLFAIQLINTF